MSNGDNAALDALSAKVAELGQICAQLSRDNADLRAEVDGLRAGSGRAVARVDAPRAVGDPGGSDLEKKVTRRGLGKVLGAAAAGAVGAVALTELSIQPASAATGSNITAGDVTTTEAGTTLQYDGSSALSGVVFLANDSTFANSDASFPAALGGWGGTHAANGVYAFTENNNGNGVVATYAGTTAGGAAVLGQSFSTAASAIGVHGLMTSTTPGGFSAAVRGENSGTGGLGIGVYGSQNGSGWGVYGTSVSGIGVTASGGTGTGVNATGGVGVAAGGTTTGVSASGGTVGVSASGPTGVVANGEGTAGIGVSANVTGSQAAVRAVSTGSGSGIHATSSDGRGGIFAGSAAQVQLTPGSHSTHPKSGKRGDLYADKSGRLWFCKRSGATASWHQIA
jgi:hypothetical protein